MSIEEIAILSQLGPILEAQDPPKSRPQPKKIDVEKRHIFDIDFGRVQASFWKGFWEVFEAKNGRFWQMRVFRENLKNVDFTIGKSIFSGFRR